MDAQLLESLQQAHEYGDFARLRELAEQALTQSPDYAAGYYYRAEAALAFSDTNKAQEDYLRASQLDASNVEYKCRLLFAALENEDVDTAEDTCDALLEQAPENADARYICGLFFLKTGMMDDCREQLDKALELSPGHKNALTTRSDLNFTEGKLDAALEDIGRLIELNPNDDDHYYARIRYRTLSPETDWAAVAADYQNVLQRNPYNALLHNLCGEAYMGLENYASAEEYFNKAIELAEGQGAAMARYYKNRGLARLFQNRFIDSMEDFRTVTDMDETDAEGYIFMAEARLRTNDINGAIGYLELGLDMVIDQKWRVYRKLGNVFLEQGNTERAEGVFKQMLKSEEPEGRAEGCFLLGNLYHSQNNLKAAYKAWDKATQMMYYPQAEAKIEEFCQEILEQERQNAENELINQYRPEFERNAKSAVLSALFGKLWKVDQAVTNQKNKLFDELPDDIKPLIMEAFANMLVLITESGLLLFNPGRTSNRFVYRLLGETSNAAKVSGQPVAGGKPQEFALGLAGGRLIMAGIGDAEVKFDLFFQETTPEALSSSQSSQLKKLLQDPETQFFGSKAQAIAQKL